ncbi:hypothetical protein [Roseateles sp. P5_E7]
MSNTRRPLLSFSALLLLMALTACGGGGGAGQASGPSSTISSPAPAPIAPAASAAAPLLPPPIVGTTPDPVPGGSVACAPGDAPQIRSTAFSLVNVTRQALGLPQFTRLSAFDGTAQSHARYAVANDTTAVEERPGLPCFTGTDVAQRLAAAGIAAASSPGLRSHSEIVIGYAATLAAEPQPWDYVNDTLHSLYGRMFLLDPRVQQLGLGFSAEPGGQRRAMVLDTALLPGTVSAGGDVWATWPRAGATGLPTQMRAANMKPLDAGLTEGYPVSLHAAAAVYVSRFALSIAADGSPVEATVLTSSNDRNGFLSEGEAALVPHAPLRAGETYRVEFDGAVGATPLHLVWSFTTAP